MRVDAPSALGLERAVVDDLVEVEGAIPPAGTSLSHTEERVLLRTVKAAGSVIEQGAQAAAAAIYKQALEFADVVNRTATAFLDLELRRSYRAWKHRNLNGWKDELEAWALVDADTPGPPLFHPEDTAAYARELEAWAQSLHEWSTRVADGPTTAVPRRTPMDYASGKRSGRPHAKLTLLLGRGYAARLRGTLGSRAAREQLAAMWPRLVASVWPAADADAVPKLRAVLQDPVALREMITDIANKTRAAPERLDVEGTAQRIERLAATYAGGDIGALTDDGVEALMGSKPLSPEAFIHRAMIGLDIMADEADLLGGDLFELMLRVDGIESFLATVIHNSGWEHGYVFEVYLVVRELFQVADPTKLWMQIVVGGKMGPDLGRLVMEDALGRIVAEGEQGALRVRLIQAKSYQDLDSVLRPSDTGKIWAQLKSDLLRLKEDGFLVTGPTGQLEISRTIEFKVDWFHLRKTSIEIPGIDAAQLHGMRESTQEVKDAFRIKYVDNKVARLNAMLDSPEFRFELGLDQTLGVHSGVPGFKLEVEIVDRIFPP
jgi:hypothetical protein